MTGCLLKIHPAAIPEPGDVIFVDPHHLEGLDDIVQPTVPFADIGEPNTHSPVHDIQGSIHTLGHTIRTVASLRNGLHEIRSHIRFRRRQGKTPYTPFSGDTYCLNIASGCLSNCAYCAIKLASEPFRSQPVEDVLKQLTTGLAMGCRRFALLSHDIGCYGFDLGCDLCDLLEALFGNADNFSLILSDLNPRWLGRYFDRFMTTIDRHQARLEDLRIPVQSGSDRILSQMKRGYDIESVKRFFSEITARFPRLDLHTHFIIGFPGETEDDFLQTVKFIETYRPAKVSVYAYEDRPGTKASLIPDKIPGDVIRKRAETLLGLKDRLAERGTSLVMGVDPADKK